MKDIEILKNIYTDTVDNLKFVEAKILALLSIEIGILYFIMDLNKDNLTDNSVIAIITSTLIAIVLLVWSILPKRGSNTNNCLYFLSWAKGNDCMIKEIYCVDCKQNILNDMYKEQITAIAQIIKKKINLIWCSVILEMVTVIMFMLYTLGRWN